ncbi:TetR/AcrR family transcriptional regulator [Phyllobacterium sp. UNC302MFCol5.2]|uniref:TetR/AcrR family transcriptional regulator n=1 Tax=Phyllobacterium sp. UNC302MFCol5.2 TaxID=1449065 RepID=UPI0004820928|nr:TetR/AcrR family transcriptional regulator [Phyllobacterium sp. UNC302MFCol5.2]
MKNTHNSRRRQDALSRERIVQVAIELLDEVGEAGLTFQVMSKRLATGPGAIYWHVENKYDLMAAACDAVVEDTMRRHDVGNSPRDRIRSISIGVFDLFDAHPWVGSALSQSAGKMPIVRLLEPIGQQVQALGVPERSQWVTVSALLSFISGVGSQNAANARFAKENDLDRASYLSDVADAWSELDPSLFPFTRGFADQLRVHDDRNDFLAGIDLILAGAKA